MVKQSLEKRPNCEQGTTTIPDLTGANPRRFLLRESCKSLGESVVELATPKRTQQSD